MKMTNREFYDTLIKIVYCYDRYQYKRNSYVGDKLFKDDAKVFTYMNECGMKNIKDLPQEDVLKIVNEWLDSEHEENKTDKETIDILSEIKQMEKI